MYSAAHSCPTLCNPMHCSSPGSSVQGAFQLSRQEYCSGLPFPTPGDLPDPGIELVFLALASGFFLPLKPPGTGSIRGHIKAESPKDQGGKDS